MATLAYLANFFGYNLQRRGLIHACQWRIHDGDGGGKCCIAIMNLRVIIIVFLLIRV